MSIPVATTNLKADVSKVPFTNDQRFYLWLVLIIVLGISFVYTIYTIKH